MQNVYNLRAEKSLSEGNIAQRLVVSHTVDLPFGRGRALLGNAPGVVDALAGGWSLSGVATFHSGFPLALTATDDNGVFSATLRPNSTGRSARLDGEIQSRLTKFFDTSAFTLPAPFTFGNVSRTLPDVRSPGCANYDMTLSKQVRLIEPLSLQIHAEAFNLTNTPCFGLPGTNLGAANFGVISTSSNARAMQLSLKLLF